MAEIESFARPPSEELMDDLRALDMMRMELATRNKTTDTLKADILALEEKCFNVMTDSDIQSIKLKVGGRMRAASLRVDTYMSVRADKKEEGYEWLKDNGLDGLFYETINSRTMTAVLKGMEEEGAELPEELINRKVVNRVTTKKG